MSGIAKFSVVALDCPDPLALAKFYGQITGWPVGRGDEESEWVQLAGDGGATIAFQRVADFVSPMWPGQDHPQQAHIDFDVDDLDAAEAAILEIGARKAEFQPEPDSFRVYFDPAGHPFCLVLVG
jgi:Glyoxalase-like domain